MVKKMRLFSPSGEAILLGLTLLTILIANSPLSDGYWAMVNWPLGVGLRSHEIIMPLSKWIKNGAMTAFFFLVTLEIKRELVDGHLTGIKKALAPVVGAIGGMMVPALVYLALNGKGNWQGWAIPTATDIAFALACIKVLGNRIPAAVTVLLVSIAIVDDLGAIAIVALGYGSGMQWQWVALGILLGGVGIVMGKMGGEINTTGGMIRWVRQRAHRWSSRPWAYGMLCVVSWIAWYKAGISPTIAGVVVAACVPYAGQKGMYHRLENTLSKWSHGLILPMFVVTHAGVTIEGSLLKTVATRECLGVMLGLCVGKPIGIAGGLLMGQWMGLIRLPAIRLRGIIGLGCLAGIGFTMSLFITHLAFGDPALMTRAQVGVLGGSLLSAVMGIGLLWRTRGNEG